MDASEPITDIHPITPPPEVGDPLGWTFYLSLVGAGLAITVAVVFWKRRGRRTSLAAPPGDPRAQALDELHALKRDYMDIPPAEFGSRVVKALRVIVADRFGEQSLSLTPDEFFERHRADISKQLDPERAERLSELLASSDQIRFAPDPDSPSTRLPLAENALEFVRDLPAPPPAGSEQQPPQLADESPAAA